MKIRNALAVTGIAVLGVVGVYGTSSAATTQPVKAPASRACVTASAPATGASVPSVLSALPAAAVPVPFASAQGASQATRKLVLVPAQKVADSCAPIVGQSPTVTLVPALKATPAVPAQGTAPAAK
jgi:hypothetical protein